MTKTQIYFVSSGAYSDYGIEGVFSTRELAERYIAEADKEYEGRECAPSGHRRRRIEEWTLDERADAKSMMVWRAMILLRDGRIREDGQHSELWHSGINEPPELRQDVCFAYSTKSQEHANKIAAEMRQQWLREKALAPA